jgi:hypothetical protein
MLLISDQCRGSGAGGRSLCFWASRIRIRNYFVLIRIWIQILPSTQKSKKKLDFYYFVRERCRITVPESYIIMRSVKSFQTGLQWHFPQAAFRIQTSPKVPRKKKKPKNFMFWTWRALRGLAAFSPLDVFIRINRLSRNFSIETLFWIRIHQSLVPSPSYKFENLW